MSRRSDPSGLDGVPVDACDPEKTPFDYIIVGSGAGGAPLASRLAQAGRRVLLLEAGIDPGANPDIDDPETLTKLENERAVFYCPGFQAAASEPELYASTLDEDKMSWHFQARHFADDSDQSRDPKAGNEGVFYPRSSSLGGCASHNTLITIYGNNEDWCRIADLTGDPSWLPDKMRYYFRRLERARYTRRRLTWMGRLLDRILTWLRPQRIAEASHGMSGWLDVTTADPRLAIKDRQMFTAIFSAVEIEQMSGSLWLWRWMKHLVTGKLYQDIDPNDLRTVRGSPEGLALIPIASGLGRRSGPREFLLRTRRDAAAGRFGAGELKIATGVLARRIIFGNGDQAPRAVGVEYITGRNIYRASRPRSSRPRSGPGRCYVRQGGEVILCGGAFNTPQLLMLSGIGDEAHLKEVGIKGPRDAEGNVVTESVVSLPGVGRNLRDRYEISVITRMKDRFTMLDGVTFNPDRSDDDAHRIWNDPKGPERERKGLYATSGPSIAVIKKSRHTQNPDDPPDLFLFGVPAAFRGYFPSWSGQLLREEPDFTGRTADAPDLDSRKLWSWVILKAYSRNRGTVRLRSVDPVDPPSINFNYFAEGDSDAQADLDALVEGVAYASRLNGSMGGMIEETIEPPVDDPEELREWIKARAWGHHACGTCRLGKDPWRASTGELRDKEAVIDSQFRVHGIESLRVVDASVFHEIPGYFIVTPTYMVSEKAADTLLEAESCYPGRLESDEAAAVRGRRRRALVESAPEDDRDPARLPSETVGLALSGGGIRSATFCLGVLQGLARRSRLRRIDFLSTISGGGYIGSFLGRLFTRKAISEAADPAGKVEDLLQDNASAPIRWLRSNADYISGAGGKDARQNYAILIRNLFTIHFVLFLGGIGAFGLMRMLGEGIGQWLPATRLPPFIAVASPWAEIITPWWWLPIAVLALCVLPGALAYWLAPKPGTTGLLSFYPTVGWAVLLLGVAVMASLPGGALPAMMSGAILIVTLVFTEMARPGRSTLEANRSSIGSVMRNKLTLSLGASLTLFVATIGWVILDTAGRACASGLLLGILGAVWGGAMPLLPAIRAFVNRLVGESGGGWSSSRKWMAATIAVPLTAILLVVLNGGTHTLFRVGGEWGIVITVLALVLSALFGRGIEFVNASSLQTGYAARLARTFLGASNPDRIYNALDAQSRDVKLTQPGDDIAFDDYHPEENGGPLHLIGTCINETVDEASERDIPSRKGFLMTVGPCGISAGRYHGVWTKPEGKLPWKVWLHNLLEGAHPAENRATAVEAIRLPGREFHPLRGKNGRPVSVERLSLRAWVAISGAAFTTGLGRQTSKPLALLLGLANIRLGYWWDTRLEPEDRPGRFREGLLRRMKRLPARVARMQSLLLSEFRARFPGPGHRYWYLSDGGHFDYTGIYELIRRRLPLIISITVGEGGRDSMEELVRQVRTDFGADITFVAPGSENDDAQNPNETAEDRQDKDPSDGWNRFPEDVPQIVRDWFAPSSIGRLEQIGSGKQKRAALARVTYNTGSPRVSWILLMRPTVTGTEPLDLVSYARSHETFPRETTLDQFFDEAQWESYRKLGELTALEVVNDHQ